MLKLTALKRSIYEVFQLATAAQNRSLEFFFFFNGLLFCCLSRPGRRTGWWERWQHGNVLP